MNIDQKWLHEILNSKLKNLNWDLAKKDMTNFLLDSSFEDLSKILNSESMIKKLNSYFS